MNDRPTNEEREALIAGDRPTPLGPDEVADVALLARLLADRSTWAVPRAGLEDEVMLAIEQAPASTDLSPTTSAARHAPKRRRRLVLPATSAAAAIAVIVGAVAVAGSNTSADFTARLTASASAAAPAARASATFTRNRAGFRVVLDARGLPTLAAGEYYEAWLKNSAAVLVPIGTFSSSDGRVTLWSGVSPKDFRKISVTIEAADGQQGSSGRGVLSGEVHAG